MRIAGKGVLRDFWQSRPEHADAEAPLQAWLREAMAANWTKPTDVKAKFRHASILKAGRVVFNIRGNKYRLVTVINYEAGLVRIRWVGTHREYDRIDVEAV